MPKRRINRDGLLFGLLVALRKFSGKIILFNAIENRETNRLTEKTDLQLDIVPCITELD